MVRFLVKSWFLSLNIFWLAWAQSPDSVRLYRAADVVVTATRTELLSSDASSPLEIAGAELIRQIHSSTVADVFRTFNNVHLMDYGPTGGTKSIMSRGLTSANVLVLVNGNSINEPLFGGVDLSLVPLSLVDHIEFLSGGGSSLYGSSASAGVVNIITRRPSDEIHAKILGEMGSFNAKRSAAEVEGRFSGVGIMTGLSKETGDDDYPFIFHRSNAADTVLKRQNGAYNRLQWFCNGDYSLTEKISLTSSLQYVLVSRGVPGNVMSVSTSSVEQQKDEVSRITIGARVQMTKALDLQINGMFSQTNRWDNDWLVSSDVLYRMKTGSMNAQVQWIVSENDRLVGGIEFGDNYLDQEGVSYGFPVNIHPSRNQKSIYIANEYTNQTTRDWFDRLLLFQSLRYDKYSDVQEDALSPRLGFNFRIFRPLDIRIRGTWSKNFRVPSFSDLYYPGFSNPMLNPERSTTVDVGILGNLTNEGNQTLQVTYYMIDTKEKIVFGSDWLPHNLGRTDHTGLEIRYDYSSTNDQFDLYAGLSFIDARKKDKAFANDPTYDAWLPYVPNSTGILGVSFLTLVGRIGIEESLIGRRFINESNTASLPAYTLTTLRWTKAFQLPMFTLVARASINNVFDTDYQIYSQYPMPGRSLRVSLSLEY